MSPENTAEEKSSYTQDYRLAPHEYIEENKNLFSLFSATQILRYGLLYNEFLLCYDMYSNERVKLAGIFQ